MQETFEGEAVWEGTVQVFELYGHPEARRCYAWPHAVDDSERRRFVAVLYKPPVDFPPRRRASGHRPRGPRVRREIDAPAN